MPKVNKDLVYYASFGGREHAVFSESDEEITVYITSNQGRYSSDGSLKFDSTTSQKFNVTIYNKDQKLHESSLEVSGESEMETHKISLAEGIRDKLPNGGVLTLNVFIPEEVEEEPTPPPTPTPTPVPFGGEPEEPEPTVVIEPEPVKQTTPLVSLERLIFLKPKSRVPFTISTDKEEYQPGNEVKLEVQLDEAGEDAEEKFYASITVTDVSSFLEVPKQKLMPSLPAMVYVEKEVR